VNAGKGCKYREIPLNQDAPQAFLDLGSKFITLYGLIGIFPFMNTQNKPFPLHFTLLKQLENIWQFSGSYKSQLWIRESIIVSYGNLSST
jgi:hypothetical protein